MFFFYWLMFSSVDVYNVSRRSVDTTLDVSSVKWWEGSFKAQCDFFEIR